MIPNQVVSPVSFLYVVAKLRNNKKTIVTFGVIAWPLYFLFCIGAAFGSDIYDLLVGDNYENRIATWFV